MVDGDLNWWLILFGESPTTFSAILCTWQVSRRYPADDSLTPPRCGA